MLQPAGKAAGDRGFHFVCPICLTTEFTVAADGCASAVKPKSMKFAKALTINPKVLTSGDTCGTAAAGVRRGLGMHASSS